METETSCQVWVSQIEAAKISGTPSRTLRDWISKGAIAVNQQREVDLIEIFLLMRKKTDEKIQKLKEGPRGKDGQRLVEAQIRKANADADLLEFKLAELERNHIALSEALADFDFAKNAIKEKFAGMGDRLSGAISENNDPHQIESILTDYIWRSLSELSALFSGEN
jgi:hypothetical protein